MYQNRHVDMYNVKIISLTNLTRNPGSFSRISKYLLYVSTPLVQTAVHS